MLGKPVNHFYTYGGHSVDYIPEIESLAFTNYYECRDRIRCDSVHVYKWDKRYLHFFTSKDSIRKIGSRAPSQSTHFMFKDKLYIMIADNEDGKLIAYQYVYRKQSRVFPFDWDLLREDVACKGVAALSILELSKDKLLLIGASYHSGEGFESKSPVYLLDASTIADDETKKLPWQLIQELPTFGAHDAEMISFQGEVYAYIAQDRNQETSFIASQVYKWNVESSQFDVFQTINGDGAHGAAFYIYNDQLFLGIANFGDRHQKRYDAESKVFVLQNNNFHEIASLHTIGATDLTFFAFEQRLYIAIANEGDFENKSTQVSQVYEIINPVSITSSEEL